MSAFRILITIAGEIVRIPITFFVMLLLLMSISSFAFLMTPIYIYRLVIPYFRFLRPDLGDIIDIRSSPFISDGNSPNYAVQFCATGKKTMNINEIRDVFLNKVIPAKCSNGDLKNIYLKQYPYRWMGYYFWKWEEKFNICDHIFEWKPESGNKKPSKLSTNDLNKIATEFLKKRFPINKSPWYLTTVNYLDPETNEEQTAVFFRLNHTFGDAYSLFQIIFKDFYNDENCIKEIDKMMKIATSFSLGTKIWKFAKIIFRGPWVLAENLLMTLQWPTWKIVNPKFKTDFITSVSDQIPMTIIKNIAAEHKVCVSAVVFSCYTAALQKALYKNSRIRPNTTHCAVTLPMPGHPEKLTIHASGIHLPLPTGETDRVKRLRKMHCHMIQARESEYYMVSMFYLVPLLFAIFPYILLKFIELSKYRTIPTAMVTVPGPKSQFKVFGIEAKSANLLCELSDACPLTCITLACNGFMKYSIMGNNGIFSCQEDLDSLIECIQQEINALSTCSGF